MTGTTNNKEVLYWTTKEKEKIDIDKMSTEHLRNALKMLVRKMNKQQELLQELACEFDAEDYGSK